MQERRTHLKISRNAPASHTGRQCYRNTASDDPFCLNTASDDPFCLNTAIDITLLYQNAVERPLFSGHLRAAAHCRAYRAASPAHCRAATSHFCAKSSMRCQHQDIEGGMTTLLQMVKMPIFWPAV